MEATKSGAVVITGGTNEVGEGIALGFGESGAKVVIIDSDNDKIDGVVSRIKGIGGEATGVVADPSKADDVKKAVKQVIDKYGSIDVLVNNVDVLNVNNTVDLSEADWSEAIGTNLDPVFLFCREVVPKMSEKKYGRIINIGSLYYLGWRGKASYSAAKSAIFGFTRSLALEVAKDNITVNCVAVGDISSPGLSGEEVSKMTASIPVQRLGKPEDVAGVVEFLASEASKYLTGQTLFVCGGRSVHFSMSV